MFDSEGSLCTFARASSFSDPATSGFPPPPPPPPDGDHHFRAKAVTIEAESTSDIGPQQGLGRSQSSNRRDCQGKLPQTTNSLKLMALKAPYSACFAQAAALLGVVWDLGAVVVIRIAVCSCIADDLRMICEYCTL